MPHSSNGQENGAPVIKNIAYHPEAGSAGSGDLFLPANAQGAKAILLIHGGAWKSMDRHRMEGIVRFLVGQGYAVFNIDYRLLPQAPYPACEEDCIKAARFLLDGGDPSMQTLDRNRIIIAGASAGGHLALMTALKLPAEKIAGIIDISGPTDLTAPEVQSLVKWSGLPHGQNDPETLLKNASPALLFSANLSPLLVLHSFNDTVVNVRQADRIVSVWREHNGPLQTFYFNGKNGHGIWLKEAPAPSLLPELENQIAAFLRSFHPPAR